MPTKTTKSRTSKTSTKKSAFKFRWWMGLGLVVLVALIGVLVVRFSHAGAVVLANPAGCPRVTLTQAHSKGAATSGLACLQTQRINYVQDVNISPGYANFHLFVRNGAPVMVAQVNSGGAAMYYSHSLPDGISSNDLDQQAPSAYPVPSTGVVHIAFGKSDAHSLEILNALGAVQRRMSVQGVDEVNVGTDAMVPGTYVFRCIGADGGVSFPKVRPFIVGCDGFSRPAGREKPSTGPRLPSTPSSHEKKQVHRTADRRDAQAA